MDEGIRQRLLKKAKELPVKSGCYLMKGEGERILYVGKAKNLRSRVSSYFQLSEKGVKTEVLLSQVKDVDFQLAPSEAEALILENNLIKKHAPKYNIFMRDNKSYPYVLVDWREPFPRMVYQRRPRREQGVEIYGPFVHGSRFSEALRIIIKSFRLRDCSLQDFRSRKEPCLLYQINQCSAPCVGKISEQDYEKDLKAALGIFRGEGAKSMKILQKRMKACAEAQEFEQAAIIRDYLDILKDFIRLSAEVRGVSQGAYRNMDVLAWNRERSEVDLTIYMVRNALLLGCKNFHFTTSPVVKEPEEEVVSFFFQYYQNSRDALPEMIISPLGEERNRPFAKAIASLGSVQVKPPGRHIASLADLVLEHIQEHQRIRLDKAKELERGLEQLKGLLSLRNRPVRLESYDIAVHQGSSPTASRVVFKDGVPFKKEYRYYHLQEREEGNNDFAMMKEVIERRLVGGDPLPDIFVVDGGKGQVKIFVEALKETGYSTPVVGIVKAPGRMSAQERLIVPQIKDPVSLKKYPELLRILLPLRDEAHRFSRKLHHKAEKKRMFFSWLDSIPGIGPKKREEILGRLKHSPNELLGKDVSEVAQLLGIQERMAVQIMDRLKELR